MRAGSRSWQLLIAFLVFWLLFLFLISLETPVSNILISDRLVSWELSKLDPLRPKSEYGVCEQLSKYYLLIVILISTYSYKVSRRHLDVESSICFLLLGLTMYFSESNFISTVAQLVIGATLLGYIFYLLLSDRNWLATFFLLLGVAVIPIGILADNMYDYEIIGNRIPTAFKVFVETVKEERFDVIGIAFICNSLIFLYFEVLREFVRNNWKNVLLILVFSFLIAIGNGLLHYKYTPPKRLEILAFIMTIAGLAGLFVTNERLRSINKTITLISSDLFYAFMLFCFVVLPTVYGRHNKALESVILWVPMMALMYVYLHRRKMTELRRESGYSPA